MKLIHQSAQILSQGNSLFEHITKCGYTCYKTDKDITEESAKKFVDNLIKSGHTSVLEHGTVYLKIPVNIDVAADFIEANPIWTKCKLVENLNGNWWAITTNYRRIIENNWKEYLQYQCEPTEYHEKRVTVRFITNIAIGRELTRHRVFSFSQESTRYCNYSYDRFNNELNFIIPNWLDMEECIIPYWVSGTIEDATKDEFLCDCWNSELYYKNLLNLGLKPQDARDVLPLSTKTELVMTGYVSDWKQVFNQRVLGTTGTPHPMIKSLLEPAMQEFLNNGWI